MLWKYIRDGNSDYLMLLLEIIQSSAEKDRAMILIMVMMRLELISLRFQEGNITVLAKELEA